MEYWELIQNRHSVRAYKSDPVEDEKILKIVESARLAPTAANKQPFKIYVIKTAACREELKRIYNRDWFVNAPIVICICAEPNSAWVRKDGKCYSDVDCAIAMDHMILTATDLGLGTCWIGAFDIKAAREVLNLEDNMEPVAFTPVGYTEAHEFKKVRKGLNDIVIYK
jgi:Nitroreductase